MTNSEMIDCGTCGYEWRRGTDGHHNCTTHLKRTVEKLKNEITEIQSSEHMQVRTVVKELNKWASKNVHRNPAKYEENSFKITIKWDNSILWDSVHGYGNKREPASVERCLKSIFDEYNGFIKSYQWTMLDDTLDTHRWMVAPDGKLTPEAVRVLAEIAKKHIIGDK